MRDTLRGFEGRGHFCTVFFTFKERDVYVYDRNSNFKIQIYGIFLN